MTESKDLIKKAFVMSVHPDKHEEYEARHRPIWPDLEAVLRDHGVVHYAIFLNDATSQLFAYAEVESEERWEEIANTEVCRRWWKSMSELMPSNANTSPVSSPLRQVFDIDGF